MRLKPWIGYALFASGILVVGASGCGGGSTPGTGGSGTGASGGEGGSGATSTSSTSSGTGGMVECGNNEVEADEKCDGTDLGGKDCASQGFVGGTLACTAGCEFDTSQCSTCGDGDIDGTEACDGADLNGKDCVTEGFGKGTLACAADCTFDTSQCDPCGNGNIDGAEACDGANFDGDTCQTLGFGPGQLTCNADCTIDTSGCNPCGNNMIDGAEQCDGPDLNGNSCQTLGYDVGMLKCKADCTLDTAMCGTEACTNGVDDTMDGLVDCLDPLCAVECSNSCVGAPNLPDPSSFVPGNTTGHADLIDDTCQAAAGGGPEVVYIFTPVQTGMADISLVSPGVDLSLSTRSTCANNATEFACKDEAFPANPGDATTEEISVQVTAGQPFFIVVEGYGAADQGAYTISAASRPIVCGDGFLDPGETCEANNLAGQTCATQGFSNGVLACNAMCNGYNVGGCTGCTHDKCSQGGPTNPACDPCVMQVCAATPSCCTTAWTPACVAATNMICGAGTCASICGNGVIEPGETCDDNNLISSDGCSSGCTCENIQTVVADANPDVAVTDNTYTGSIASMTCMPVVVANVTGCNNVNITSLSVTVAMDHTWVGDMTIKLVHPDNSLITLLSRPGVVESADDGNDVAGVGDSSNLVKAFPITFQMGAPVSAETMGSTLSTTQNICQNDGICTFAPANGAAAAGNLNTFVGKPAAGTWQFCVGDSAGGDLGSIDKVTLTIGK